MRDERWETVQMDDGNKEACRWEVILKDLNNVAPNSHKWSEGTYRLFGYEPGQVPVNYALLMKHIHPEDRQLVKSAIASAVKECQPLDVRYRIITLDSRELYVHGLASIEYYFGSTQWKKLNGAITDITEVVKEQLRKGTADQLLDAAVDAKAEPQTLQEALNATQRRELERIFYPELVKRLDQAEWHLMESQRIAHIGSWQIIIKDLEHVVPGSQQWSDELFRILGYEPNEIEVSLEGFLDIIHPEDRERVQETLMRSIAQCTEYQVEHRAIRKDGKVITLLEKGECSHYLGSDKWVKIVGTTRDITAQKKAEHYEASLSSIFENTSLSYTLLDAELRIILFNEPSYHYSKEYTGIALEEGRCILDYVSDGRQQEARQMYQSVLEGNDLSTEHCYKRAEGDKWFQVHMFPVQLSNRNVSGVAVSMEDITDRKRAEEILEAERAKYKALYEHSGDAVLLTERDGDILEANPAACALFRMTEQEIRKAGRFGLVDLQHPNLKPMLEERQKSGQAKGELLFVRKDGSTFPGILTSVEYKDTQGQCRTSMLVRDITKQKLAEEALKRRNEEQATLLEHLNQVREQERASVARELHDELGQQLTSLKIGVSMVKEKMQLAGLAEEGISSLLDEIGEAVKSVRRISFNLRPVILDYEGLSAALQWFAEEYEKRHKIKVVLDIRLEEDVRDQQLGIILFRVVQESLTNVLRHAQATQVKVVLEQAREGLELHITDDGVGIDLAALKAKRNFGIVGMKERVASVGGQFSIGPKKPWGTVVKVSVPLVGIADKLIR